MADESIRKDFVDGVQEIFTTLFNDGKSDGLNLYLMSENTKTNVYKESKYKLYKAPIRLVTQARLTPTHGETKPQSSLPSATRRSLVPPESGGSKYGIEIQSRSHVQGV